MLSCNKDIYTYIKGKSHCFYLLLAGVGKTEFRHKDKISSIYIVITISDIYM